jgi:acetoin utilization protein AcuB
MFEPRSDRDVTVRDIMTKNPATLDTDEKVNVAEHLIKFGSIRHLPVLTNGQVVGVVSQRDLFRSALISDQDAPGAGAKPNRKNTEIAVKEIMSTPAVTISPETSVKEAARKMMEKRIGCLPVVQGDELLGLITETDILQYVVEY